jgi:prepilin peptidase CpaA
MNTNPELMTSAAVVTCSLVAAVIDLRTRRVPNGLTGASAAVGLALAISGVGRIGVAASLIGGGIGLALMLPGYLFGSTGGGDVKLLAAIGTLVGPDRIFVAYFGMAIAGGLLAVATALARRRFRNQTFAYAPAIALGAIVAVLR